MTAQESPHATIGRIAISAVGTRDEVLPYLVLARRLMAQGHEVLVLAPEQYSGVAAEQGVPFEALPGDILILNDPEEAHKALAGTRGMGAGLKLLDYMRPIQERYLEAEWAALEPFAPDLIVYHPKSIGVPHMAERLGCPTILASTAPGYTPTGAFSSPLLPFRSLGPFNKLGHHFAIRSASNLFKKSLRRFRADRLGLGERGRGSKPAATIYAYSPHVLPPPRDWKRNVLVSGYWFSEQPDWQPSPELQAFLAAGAPPVLVDIVPLPGLDPARPTAIVLEALEKAGKRGILLTGHGGLALDEPPAHAFALDDAPYETLLSMVDAAIHPASAASTGAVLAAGKVSCACAQIGVPPFWARGIKALGVGPEPITMIAFSVDRLVAVLEAMDDPGMRERAEKLGEAIRTEDGPGAAADFIGAFLPRPGA